MTKEIIWINGRVVKKKDAVVSVFDHGLLYGDGIFETMKAYNGKAFRIDRHLARLFSAAEILKIKIPYTKKILKNTISGLSTRFRSSDAYVRLTVTRGEGRTGLDPALCKRPNVIIYLKDFVGCPETHYKKGARVIISKERRNNHSVLSALKSNNYLNSISAFIEAKKRGRDDAIMLNADGFAAESTTGNIFIVKGKDLITPPASEGLLPGITREAVMEIAPILALKVRQRRISLSELKTAEEAFITNSLIEIKGVIDIGGVKICGGRVGPATKLLHLLYQGLVKAELGI